MKKHVPEGYHTATPYLIIDGASEAIEYYKKAFGATELYRLEGPDGKVGHAEIQIGNSRLMMADEHPQMGHKSPGSLNGTPVSIVLYVEDCDAVFKKAVAAGGKVQKELKDQFYGDRSGTLQDPYGHVWTVSTHVEDIAPEEIERRAAAMMKTGS